MTNQNSPYATAMALRIISEVGNPDPPDEMEGATFVATLLEHGYPPAELTAAIKAAWSHITALTYGWTPNFHDCAVAVTFRNTFLESLRPGIAARTLLDIKRRGQLHRWQDLDATTEYLREADQETETNADRHLLDAYDQAIANGAASRGGTPESSSKMTRPDFHPTVRQSSDCRISRLAELTSQQSQDQQAANSRIVQEEE